EADQRVVAAAAPGVVEDEAAGHEQVAAAAAGQDRGGGAEAAVYLVAPAAAVTGRRVVGGEDDAVAAGAAVGGHVDAAGEHVVAARAGVHRQALGEAVRARDVVLVAERDGDRERPIDGAADRRQQAGAARAHGQRRGVLEE